MFKVKGGLQGRSNVLSERDRKTLRNNFVAQFPKKTVEDFNRLLPLGESLSTFSLKGVPCEVYIVNEVPVFFTLTKKKNAQLFPTLQSLFQIPDLLPQIVVEPRTPQYLIRGADLMLPGCIQPAGGYTSIGMDLDQAWSVRIRENPVPFAVGQIAMTTDELGSADKGKIMQVHHVLGDQLFKMSVPAPLPAGFTEDTYAAVERSVDSESESDEDKSESEADSETETSKAKEAGDAGDSDEEGPETATNTGSAAAVKRTDQSARPTTSEDEEDSPQATAEDLDGAACEALVELCVVELIKRRWIDAQLPLDISALWGDISKLLPVVMERADEEAVGVWLLRRGVKVDGETFGGLRDFANKVDLRVTGWRNLKKMANHFKRNKLWTTKEIRGQVSVVKLNRSHPLVSAHKTLLPEDAIQLAADPTAEKSKAKKDERAVNSSSGARNESAGGPLQAVVAYGITGSSRDLFADIGRTSKDALMTEEDVILCLQKMLNKIAAVAEGKEDTFPSMDQDEPADDDKAWMKGPDVAWSVDLLMRDSKLSALCLSKTERNEIKAGGAAIKTINKKSIFQHFIKAGGVKPVTLLLKSRADLADALLKPQNYGAIEADARITVSLQKTKRFIRTRVAGIHDFPMIDPKNLAERLQKACAAAATLCELEDVKGKVKPMGVVVQGNVVREVCSVLESQYGLPAGMVIAQG